MHIYINYQTNQKTNIFSILNIFRYWQSSILNILNSLYFQLKKLE